MSKQPISPPSEEQPKTIPLDDPIRKTPIHHHLPDLRVPNDPLQPQQYHPLTCLPLDPEEVRAQVGNLRREYPSRAAAMKAQDQAAKEAKEKIERAEKKRAEVQGAMDKKVKERNTEMKVLSKFQEVKASDIPG